MLELIDLTASHGRTRALHGLSLQVGTGRVHALLGRNGAGKTTALRRIVAQLPPEAGRIMFDGLDITGWPAPRIARAGIGFVPEGREVFTTLSVRENLTLAGRIGRALMTSPRLVLLDEPSEGLSVGTLAVLRDALLMLKTHGMSLLLVEQNIGFATALADDVTLMSRGRAVWSGGIAAFADARDERQRYLGA